MEDNVKRLMNQMESDTRTTLVASNDELCKILKPINATKLTYTEKMKFLDDNGFNKAWIQIKKIVEAHQWLYSNCVEVST